jgi:hypothetical protein
MPLWLQYVIVALVVLLALWMFLRRQFPGTVRRVRHRHRRAAGA